MPCRLGCNRLTTTPLGKSQGFFYLFFFLPILQCVVTYVTTRYGLPKKKNYMVE